VIFANAPQRFGIAHNAVKIKHLAAPNQEPAMNELNTLRDQLRTFATEREWDQFHSPKNLAMALSVEASELLEHFQWKSETESAQPSADELRAVSHEAADVLLYLIRIADKLNIDLVAAAKEKIVLNAQKYPVERARGSSKKYDEI
jgi:dCTP diphosphatase